jgi:hypothetical protein
MSASLTQLPVYGRKYQIDVLVPQPDGSNKLYTLASDSFEPNALRVTFDIYQIAFQVYWYADIVIYNLDELITEQFLSASMQSLQVVVSAGYQNGAYGVIWSGPVFQALFDRENVVDFRTNLHCILGLQTDARNFVNQTFPAGMTQTGLITEIAKSAFTKIPVDKLSSSISPSKLPRAKAVFGKPGKYFSEIATDNGMTWWLSQKGLTMGGLNDDDIPSTPSLTFSPPVENAANMAGNAPTNLTNGVIIGTPQQTQFGVAFRVLLDPRVQVNKPFVVVKIDNSQIRVLRQQISANDSRGYPRLLDQDGIYIVGAVRFIGDSRGNDWYADIEGYTSTLSKQAFMAAVVAGV